MNSKDSKIHCRICLKRFCSEGVTRKKGVSSSKKKTAVCFRYIKGLNLVKSYNLISITRSSFYFVSNQNNKDKSIRFKLRKLTFRHWRFGYQKL